MKKLLVILLLFIFSAQGTVVALGGGILLAEERAGVTEMTLTASPAEDCGDNDDYLKVASSIEEMSDYVALDPPLTQLSGRALTPPSAAPVLSSIDLPRALPPPRG